MARLRLGFVPLNDAAAVIVAAAKGFFAAEGLEVDLSREVSWATIRDKMSVGALDGAHMLAPLALAMTLGLAGGDAVPLLAPLALALNGPAVTVSARLAAATEGLGDVAGLARLVRRRREEGASPLTFAVVFPFSVHNYLLRDWLAAAGVDPDHDIRLTVAPPSRMKDLLAEGVVEGFCVTEPWDAAAAASGAGSIVLRGSELWPRMPDKVLAVPTAWARRNPDSLRALSRAILAAAAWADAPENRRELCSLLSQPQYVGVSAEVIESGLTDLIFHRDAANAPLEVHAAWLMSQMMRWGHIPPDVDIAAVARQVYRADLYQGAARAETSLPEVLIGWGAAGSYTIGDARQWAREAPLSRIAGHLVDGAE